VAPLLSICIPTHDGRAATLDETLASICREASDFADLVEVCVSDNASTDGTDEVTARQAEEAPFAIRYHRDQTNLGFSSNLQRAVAMARGRWCWLLSSDDALLPGAVGHVLWLADRYPEASGISVGAAWFDHELRAELPVIPATVPAADGATDRLLEGREAVLSGVGHWWAYMSGHVVRADAWRAAVAATPSGFVGGRMFPHAALFARIVHDRPAWAWSPAALIAGRGDNASHGRIDEVDHGLLLARVAREWRRLVLAEVPEKPLRRELADEWVRVYASGQTLRDRLALGMSARGRAALAATLARWAWASPALWRDTLPHLARGGATPRAAHPGNGSSAPLDPRSLRARLTVDPPVRWFPRAGVRLACRLEHRGDRPYPDTPPHSVAVGARWIEAASGAVVDDRSRARLGGPLAPGAAVELELELRAPERPGRYRLRISPLQEHVAWFDDLDGASGWSREVAVELPVTEAVDGVAR
jgi:glycosyl transferase family 2